MQNQLQSVYSHVCIYKKFSEYLVNVFANIVHLLEIQNRPQF